MSFSDLSFLNYNTCTILVAIDVYVQCMTLPQYSIGCILGHMSGPMGWVQIKVGNLGLDPTQPSSEKIDPLTPLRHLPKPNAVTPSAIFFFNIFVHDLPNLQTKKLTSKKSCIKMPGSFAM